MLYVHEGARRLRHDLRAAPLRPGDYLVLPIGTTWRLDPGRGLDQRMLYLEARPRSSRPSAIATTTASSSSTRPTRSATSTLPDGSPPRTDEGEFASTSGARPDHRLPLPAPPVRCRRLGRLPLAVPFNIGDFQPITGRVHQPPPVHQTFQARNFVVCSFVPRKFDYHPLAIPAPYNHSNINSDEVIYYVAGNFMSRRGVDIASFTLHPAGIPHGPHPGTAEASIGKEATEELAVMVDTFHPLKITRQAADLDDPRYPYSWLPAEDAPGEARELADAARRRSRTEDGAPRPAGAMPGTGPRARPDRTTEAIPVDRGVPPGWRRMRAHGASTRGRAARPRCLSAPAGLACRRCRGHHRHRPRWPAQRLGADASLTSPTARHATATGSRTARRTPTATG